MRALKVLVIGMGILIVIGVGAVGYGLYTKSSSLVKKTASAPSPRTSSKMSGAWKQDLMISLPAGCIIDEVKTDGNRIYVIISGTPQEGQTVCSRVIVVNSISGQRLGTIKVIP